MSALRIKFPDPRQGTIIEILIWIKMPSVPLVSSIYVSQTIRRICFLFCAADLRDIQVLREEQPCTGL